MLFDFNTERSKKKREKLSSKQSESMERISKNIPPRFAYLRCDFVGQKERESRFLVKTSVVATVLSR